MSITTSRWELAQAALRLSREMLKAVEQERWDALGLMQEERERLIAALFSKSAPDHTTAPEWVGIVREIQMINEALVVQVTQQRTKLGQELKGIQSARKVNSAYTQAMNIEE